MFLRTVLLSVVLILPQTIFAQYPSCRIDDRSSQIKATVRLEGRSFVVDFDEFSVTAQCNGSRMFDLLMIINTDNFSAESEEDKDRLRKYFDAKGNGVIVFRSEDVPYIERDKLVIIGTFTLRDKEKTGQIELLMPRERVKKKGFTEICFEGTGATELLLKADDNAQATLALDRLKLCLLIPND